MTNDNTRPDGDSEALRRVQPYLLLQALEDNLPQGALQDFEVALAALDWEQDTGADALAIVGRLTDPRDLADLGVSYLALIAQTRREVRETVDGNMLPSGRR